MSDFLTRLVERQAGTLPMVQPRRPSMFAPPVSRPGSADLPVIGGSPAIDDISAASAASVSSNDHGEQALKQPDEPNGRRPVHASPPAARAAVEPRRTESSPAPLVRNNASVAHQPAQAVPSAPRIEMVSSREQVPGREAGLSGQRIQDPFDVVSALPEARIEPPPRLVDTRHDTVHSSAAVPPSLARGTVTGRRAELPDAASTAPPIEVTIGRIEVMALSTAPDTKRKPASRRPAMSLEEYLIRRQRGKA